MALTRNELLTAISRLGLFQAAADGHFDTTPVLPLDRHIAISGDSRTANTHSGSAPNEIEEAYGYGSWMCQYTDGRVRISAARNGGVGGDTTADWLARVPAIIAYGAKVIVTLIGTNDRGGANLSLETSKRNIESGVRLQLQAGCIPILVAETPRTGLAGQQLSNHLALRDWIKSYFPTIGVRVADPWPDLVSRDAVEAAAGIPAAGLFHDGLHPAPAGARIIGEHIAKQLIDLFPAKLALPVYDAPYDAVTNVTGNLNTNPLMAGTGGSISGSAFATGVVATGYTLVGSNFTAGTSVASKEVHPEAGEFQVLKLGGTIVDPSSYTSLDQNISLANLDIGDKIQAIASVHHEGLAGVAGVSLDIRFVRGGTAYYVKHGDRYQEDYPLDDTPVTGPHETPILTIDGTETDIKVRLVVYGCAGIPLAGTIKVGQISIHKVL